jgi:hypothetical protein
MMAWILIGVVLVGLMVVAMVALRSVRRPPPAEPSQQAVREADIGAKVGLGQLECQECGAMLEDSSIRVKEGLTVVSCPYCDSRYQLYKEATQ